MIAKRTQDRIVRRSFGWTSGRNALGERIATAGKRLPFTAFQRCQLATPARRRVLSPMRAVIQTKANASSEQPGRTPKQQKFRPTVKITGTNGRTRRTPLLISSEQPHVQCDFTATSVGTRCDRRTTALLVDHQ
jgi:hypothetical protein